MAGIDLGLIIAFACGMILMAALRNPRGTSKFLRGFLGGISRSAQNLNRGRSPDATRRPESDRRRDDDDRYYDDRQPRGSRRKRRLIECPRCYGKGTINPTSIDFTGRKRRCPDCDGTGEIHE